MVGLLFSRTYCSHSEKGLYPIECVLFWCSIKYLGLKQREALSIIWSWGIDINKPRLIHYM